MAGRVIERVMSNGVLSEARSAESKDWPPETRKS